MTGIYNFIYQLFSTPFGYLIGLAYDLFNQNYLLAVIFFAVMVKLILLPTSINQQKRQAKTKRMRKRIAKIQAQYADDQAKQQEALQEFYKKEGFGGMGTGCGAMLVQMIIIIGLYGAIYNPLTYILRVDKRFGDGIIDALKTAAEGFTTSSRASSGGIGFLENTVISNITELKDVCLQFPNGEAAYEAIRSFSEHFVVAGFSFGDVPRDVMADSKLVLLIPAFTFISAMLSSIYSLIRTRRMSEASAATNMMSMGCMMIGMPFFSLWLSYSFPVGIGVYWGINSLLSVLQMVLLDLFYKPEKVIAKDMVEESIVRKNKEQLKKLTLVDSDK